MTRAEAVEHFRKKVLLLARRVYERLSPESTIQMEDLVSYGAIGLLEAFDRYDAKRGILFSTYAEYRIRGAMYDALRTQDSFTRRRRQLSRRVENATDSVRKRLDREPLPEEVAVELEMTLDEYWRAVDRVKPVSHVSLDAPVDEEERPLIEKLMSNPTANPDVRLAVQQIREELKEAVRQLPDRQRQCVLMYYGKDLSLAEIAAVYGVTVSRISQILSQARDKLRKKLAPTIDRADLDLGGVE